MRKFDAVRAEKLLEALDVDRKRPRTAAILHTRDCLRLRCLCSVQVW